MKRILLFLVLAACATTPTQDADSESCGGMTLEEARAIASSECGPVKSTYSCNAGTNTYWIDLTQKQEGCNPACVIDVTTGDAVVNSRCTGAVPAR